MLRRIAVLVIDTKSAHTAGEGTGLVRIGATAVEDTAVAAIVLY